MPVLERELLERFAPLKIGRFLDGTLGAGGHAAAILAGHPEIERYVGVDRDSSALALAKERLKRWGEKVEFFHGDFCEGAALLPKGSFHGILLDLGVSSMQLDRAERGFSFSREGPLDMRMNPEEGMSAADAVNQLPEKELGRIFREYGEERRWRAAARAICAARKGRPILTTGDLTAVLAPLLKRGHKREVNPLTLIFQALRIFVNRELELLREALPLMLELLAPAGRLAVISFHSLEDRIVKHYFREEASDKVGTSGIGGVFLSKEPTVKLVTRKPERPDQEEIARNPRSRSARLRIVERCG